jgi:hypothetical protein
MQQIIDTRLHCEICRCFSEYISYIVQEEDLTIGISLTQTESMFIPIEVNINTNFIFVRSNIINTGISLMRS